MQLGSPAAYPHSRAMYLVRGPMRGLAKPSIGVRQSQLGVSSTPAVTLGYTISLSRQRRGCVQAIPVHLTYND